MRTSLFPQDHIPPLDRTVTDAAAVQRLYTAMYALPHVMEIPPGASIACPADIGIVDHLTFLAGTTVVERADAYTTGCQVIMVSSSNWRVPNDAFWALLAQTLGITHAELFPWPVP